MLRIVPKIKIYKSNNNNNNNKNENKKLNIINFKSVTLDRF